MKKSLLKPLLLTLLVTCFLGCRNKKPAQHSPIPKTPIPLIVEEQSQPQDVNDSSDVEHRDLVIYKMKMGDAPYSLCKQMLTSEETLLKLTPENLAENYLSYDYIPVKDAFLNPEPDIVNNQFVKDVQNYFNYITVANVVNHAYGLFLRKYHDTDSTKQEDDAYLQLLVAEDYPKISSGFLKTAIPDNQIRHNATVLLNGYKHFNINKEDEFEKSVKAFNGYLEKLPKFVNEEIDSMEFYSWYEKSKVLPEYQQLHSYDTKDFSGKDNECFVKLVQNEKDIDKRIILAMEFSRFDRMEGVILLGEILESGRYTKYLYEAWSLWTGLVQGLYCGYSSYSIIPDNYYSMIKAKCVNSILRYIQNTSNKDHKKDLIILTYFLHNHELRRFACDYGNEALFLDDLGNN